MARRVAVALMMIVMGSSLAEGGQNVNAQLALDAQVHTSKRACGATYPGCGGIQDSLDATGYYDVIVVLYNFDNVRAVSYSLDWPSGGDWYFYGFSSCSNLLLGGTAGPPLNVAQSWTEPLIAASDTTGVMVGWLRLWSDEAGTIAVGPYPDSDGIQFVDSLYAVDESTNFRTAGVGGSGGTNPCE